MAFEACVPGEGSENPPYWLYVSDIQVGERRRGVDLDAVQNLAASIKEIGLREPIRVVPVEGGYRLVSGLHRLRATEALGHQMIRAITVRWTDDECRMWEIAENLHRAELTALERAEQIAEWAALVERRTVAQVEPPSRADRVQSGVRLASRELGLDRNEVQRAAKIASLTPEAKQAACDLGLDDNQSALLNAAKKPADEQVEALQARAAKKPARAEESPRALIARWLVGLEVPDEIRAAYRVLDPQLWSLVERFEEELQGL